MTDDQFMQRVIECLLAAHEFWGQPKRLTGSDYTVIGNISTGLTQLRGEETNNPDFLGRDLRGSGSCNY